MRRRPAASLPTLFFPADNIPLKAILARTDRTA